MWQAWQILRKILQNNFLTILFFSVGYRILSSGFLLLGKEYFILDHSSSFAIGGMFLLGILLSCFLILWEIASFLFLFHQCGQQKTVGIIQMAWGGFVWVVQLWRWQNSLLLPLVLLLLPFNFVIIWSDFFLGLELPDFILQFLGQSFSLRLFMNGFGIFLQVCAVQTIFLFHYLFIWQKPVLLAFQDSKKMGWRRLCQTALALFFWNGLWTVGGFLLYCLFLYAGNYFLTDLGRPSFVQQILFTVSQGLERIFLFLQDCVLVPVSIAIVHSFYQVFLYGEDSAVCASRFSWQNKYISVGISLFILLGAVGYFYAVYQSFSTYHFDLDSRKVPVIVAHRGYSKNVLENTIASVLAAKEMGITHIEIDVQMTKDGKLVVFHDHNLSQTLGISKQVGEMDWLEIEKMLAEKYGAFPRDQWPLPLLSQVLAAGGKEMNWNIEIKGQTDFSFWRAISDFTAFLHLPVSPAFPSSGPSFIEVTQYQKQMTENILFLLQQENLLSQTMISSLQYGILEEVKAMCSEIPTLYIVPFATNEINSLTAADGFSVEVTALTPQLYQQILRENKSLWVWTINRVGTAAKLFSYGVDGIITDEPLLMRKLFLDSQWQESSFFRLQFLFS